MKWKLFDLDDSMLVDMAERDDCILYAQEGLGALLILIDLENKHIRILNYKKYR